MHTPFGGDLKYKLFASAVIVYFISRDLFAAQRILKKRVSIKRAYPIVKWFLLCSRDIALFSKL